MSQAAAKKAYEEYKKDPTKPYITYNQFYSQFSKKPADKPHCMKSPHSETEKQDMSGSVAQKASPVPDAKAVVEKRDVPPATVEGKGQLHGLAEVESPMTFIYKKAGKMAAKKVVSEAISKMAMMASTKEGEKFVHYGVRKFAEKVSKQKMGPDFIRKLQETVEPYMPQGHQCTGYSKDASPSDETAQSATSGMSAVFSIISQALDSNISEGVEVLTEGVHSALKNLQRNHPEAVARLSCAILSSTKPLPQKISAELVQSQPLQPTQNRAVEMRPSAMTPASPVMSVAETPKPSVYVTLERSTKVTDPSEKIPLEALRIGSPVNPNNSTGTTASLIACKSILSGYVDTYHPEGKYVILVPSSNIVTEEFARSFFSMPEESQHSFARKYIVPSNGFNEAEMTITTADGCVHRITKDMNYIVTPSKKQVAYNQTSFKVGNRIIGFYINDEL